MEICRVREETNREEERLENLEKNQWKGFAALAEAHIEFKESFLAGNNKQVPQCEIAEKLNPLMRECLSQIVDNDYDGDYGEFFKAYNRGEHQSFKQPIKRALNKMADYHVGELE